MTTDEAKGYVAGMIDGEGCVNFCHDAEGRVSRRAVVVTNTELELIDAYVEAAAFLGFKVRVHRCEAPSTKKKGWKARYDAFITGRTNLERLAAEVPIRSARKRERLEEMLASYTHQQWAWSDVPLERLRELYEKRNWPMQKCATELGVSIATIHRWLHKAEIPTKRKGAVYG